ncbi:MAG: glycoside hydrolase family 15 protein, partial [Firmicutes bacterium]|nr:glycoside hydrolase family 15 protein [Bacillota bacterium]
MQKIEPLISVEHVDARLRRPPVFASAAKQGVGTAWWDGVSECLSRVWFTLAQGALTEVYYPSVATPNLRWLEWLVSDGDTFFHSETLDTLHDVEQDGDALAFTQVNTAENGRYSIAKTYAVDPLRDALLVHVRLTAHGDRVPGTKIALHLAAHPAVGGSVTGMELSSHALRQVGVAAREGSAFALACSVPWIVTPVVAESVESCVRSLVDGVPLGPHPSDADGAPPDLRAPVDDPSCACLCATVELSAEQARAWSCVIAIGFGENEASAIACAQAALADGFGPVRERYLAGWRGYLAGLSLPRHGDRQLARIAAMTLRAHEDKSHPGAVAASLSIPWGHVVDASVSGSGGYHLVWPRDLYHVASGLLLVGDRDYALRALGFLQDVLQRPNGAFPQNAWPDGRSYWTGLQLDQIAYPILLADLAAATDTYSRMIFLAADFLVRRGPSTEQERWEENRGYSPSTLAAVCAAFVVAGEAARRLNDPIRAAVYLSRADALYAGIDGWTVTRAGGLSDRPYYLRISDTGRPDDGHWITLKNGGGTHPKTEIVDAGFLELVRLGIKPADDPVITNSLAVVDKTILWEGPYGPVWYRYPHDGYGEGEDGGPYTGAGRGRPWPVLTGERGEFEVALLETVIGAPRDGEAGAAELEDWPNKVAPPAGLRFFGPERLLETMMQSAGPGGMIPEQVWDAAAIPDRGLYPGKGTGSATPLAWAMAQYLRLAKAIDHGRVSEQPPAVRQRFVEDPPAQGPNVILEEEKDGRLPDTSEATFALSGRGEPGTTVAFVAAGRITGTRVGADGRFKVRLHVFSAGRNDLLVVGYDGQRSVCGRRASVHYTPALIAAIDNQNPHTMETPLFAYPQHPDFAAGDFKIERVTVRSDDERFYVQVRLGHLDDPWAGPTGLSKQLIDIYIRTG